MQLLGMLLRVGRVEDDVVRDIPMEYAIHDKFASGQGFQLGGAHVCGKQLQLLVIVVGQDEG